MWLIDAALGLYEQHMHEAARVCKVGSGEHAVFEQTAGHAYVLREELMTQLDRDRRDSPWGDVA